MKAFGGIAKVEQGYREEHFPTPRDVVIAWNHDRIWVCLDGVALLRVKVQPDGSLQVLFTPPEEDIL